MSTNEKCLTRFSFGGHRTRTAWVSDARSGYGTSTLHTYLLYLHRQRYQCAGGTGRTAIYRKEKKRTCQSSHGPHTRKKTFCSAGMLTLPFRHVKYPWRTAGRMLSILHVNVAYSLLNYEVGAAIRLRWQTQLVSYTSGDSFVRLSQNLYGLLFYQRLGFVRSSASELVFYQHFSAPDPEKNQNFILVGILRTRTRREQNRSNNAQRSTGEAALRTTTSRKDLWCPEVPSVMNEKDLWCRKTWR